MEIMKQFSFPNEWKSWPKGARLFHDPNGQLLIGRLCEKTMILTTAKPRISFFAWQDATTLGLSHNERYKNW